MSLSDVDIQAIKTRQQGTWASGDYAVIGTTLQITGELLCEAVDIAAGERVLDVAAGNGNAALAAARRGGDVTACDYVPALLERAQARAAADGLDLHIHDADAEAMPFETASFDAVLSTFGVMFCPNHEQRRRRVDPGLQAGRSHRADELDTRGIHRADVQDRRALRPAAGWTRFATGLGNPKPPCRAVRRRSVRAIRSTSLRLPVPLGGALAADVPGVLRPDAQGVRIARPARRSGTRERPLGPRPPTQHGDSGVAADRQ